MPKMMDPQAFYQRAWSLKQSGSRPPMRRDPIHRYLLDPIFDPLANPRYDVAMALLKPGIRLLDVGCWDGRLLRLASPLFRELHGVDVVPEGVKLTRESGFAAQVVDLNTQPLPFPDAHFDAVTALAVIEHIFDPYHVIREIRRVLRPDGQLVLDVPNVASFTNRLRILAGRLPVTGGNDPGWDGGHLHYFTKHALDRFLHAEGFQVLVRRTTGGHPHFREWWMSLLAGELIYSCRRLS